jgi:hypothetical protein
MKIRDGILVCLLTFAVCAFSAVGEPEAAPKAEAAAEQKDAPRHDNTSSIPEEDLREMVSTILMVRVSRSLELSDEQTVVMVKHMQEMRDELTKIYSERDEMTKALRELSEKEGASDDEISAKLQGLMEVDQKRAQAKRSTFEKVSAGLTPKQKAKLYLTLQEFEGQMRKMMVRAKEMGDDAIREKFQEWNRGDGQHRPAERPAVKEFMKNRRLGQSGEETASSAPAAEASAPASKSE